MTQLETYNEEVFELILLLIRNKWRSGLTEAEFILNNVVIGWKVIDNCLIIAFNDVDHETNMDYSIDFVLDDGIRMLGEMTALDL